MTEMPSPGNLAGNLAKTLAHQAAARGLRTCSVEGLRPLASDLVHGKAATAHEFGDDPALALLSFDADRIASFVFASNRPQVVAGASRMLEAWNRGIAAEGLGAVDLELRGVPHCVVYSAGGSGTILFPRTWFQEHGGHVMTALVGSIRKSCPGLSLTTADVEARVADFAGVGADVGQAPADTGSPLLDRWRVAQGFPGLMARLATRLRARKDAKLHAAVPPDALEDRERCPSCWADARSADRTLDEDLRFCTACRAKREHWQRQWRETEEGSQGVPYFTSIADLCKGRRKSLGFLYADGNAIGHLVSRLPTLAAFHEFSRGVQAIFREALDHAVENGGLDRKDEGRGYVSLLSGGDELILVLPGNRALPLARDIAQSVEKGFGRLPGRCPALEEGLAGQPEVQRLIRSAGAGIGCVLAPPTYPIRYLRHYAGALQREAKSRFYAARAAGGGDEVPRSVIDYEIIRGSSPWTTDIAARRKRELVEGGAQRGTIHRTARPLSVGELALLLHDLAAYRRAGVGRSQLYALREVSSRSFDELVLHLRYQCARLPSVRRWVKDCCKGYEAEDLEHWLLFEPNEAGGVVGHRRLRIDDLVDAADYLSEDLSEDRDRQSVETEQ